MAEGRIYFVVSNDGASYEPSTKILYWEPGTGIKELASTNTRFELPTARIARRPDGTIFVTGMRWERWTNSAGEPLVEDPDGLWWENADTRSTFSTGMQDVLLYSLDAELENPTELTVDVLGAKNSSSATGWIPQDNRSVYSSDGIIMPFYDPNHGIIVVGDRFRPYTEQDASEGDIINIYSEDGVLVKRDWAYQGAYGPYNNSPDYHQLEAFTKWAAHDPERGYIYTYVDWSSIARYDLNSGETLWAPGTFMWPQSIASSSLPAYNADRVRYDRGEGALGSRYGYITRTAGSFWRARYLESFAVDPVTGYVWALVDAYYPGYGEFAIDCPPLAVPGYRNQEDHKYQLVCLDPDLLNWRPVAGPLAPGEINLNKGFSKAPQFQAEVEVIDLSHGPGFDFYTMAIAPEGGAAYIAYESDAIDPDYWRSIVMKVDFATGEQTQMFMDDRAYTYPGDSYDGYRVEGAIRQLLPVGAPVLAQGPMSARRAFKA